MVAWSWIGSHAECDRRLAQTSALGGVESRSALVSTCSLSSAAAVHWLFGFSNFASSMGTLCFTSVSFIVKLKSDRS